MASGVYFAIATHNSSHCKIGQSSDISARNRQLSKDGYYIINSAYVESGETGRLFVESYLRAKIESLNIGQRIGLDYFFCKSVEGVKWLAERFEGWVGEAIQLLPKESTPELPLHKINLPIPHFNDILTQLEKCGMWVHKEQMTTTEQLEVIHHLRTYFVQKGYKCETSRNYSWACFTITKIY